ncbi:MAG: hypothetical protein EPN85_11985 [Bacteroidetes bacterium]|nr:MAG: hypothetical protein EPN85_11985 [Bacteroidota bacterium]
MYNNLISIQELIISLIKDDLTNTRLVNGLNTLGLDSGDYNLNLSDTIFKLLSIDDDREELFEEYLKWCEEIIRIDILKYPEFLDTHARGIYKKLLKEKKKFNEGLPG